MHAFNLSTHKVPGHPGPCSETFVSVNLWMGAQMAQAQVWKSTCSWFVPSVMCVSEIKLRSSGLVANAEPTCQPPSSNIKGSFVLQQ